MNWSHLMVLVLAFLVGAYAVKKIPSVDLIGRVIP